MRTYELMRDARPDSKMAPSVHAYTAATFTLRRSDQGALIAIAVALGLTIGISVWVFQQGIKLFHLIFQTWFAGEVLTPIVGAVAVVISLTIAGALVGLVVSRLVGHEQLHGVASVMEAVAYGGGQLPYRKMPAKALASMLSLGAGASVGPEDPSVQIGASLGSWFGSLLRLHGNQLRLLVAAGVAAAIAAAFKAPIAGVFFALEVILNGTFDVKSFAVIVLAAVVSSGMTQALDPTLEMGPFNYSLGSPLEIPLFLPLGNHTGLCLDWLHSSALLAARPLGRHQEPVAARQNGHRGRNGGCSRHLPAGDHGGGARDYQRGTQR